jgi:hypothetical protein
MDPRLCVFWRPFSIFCLTLLAKGVLGGSLAPCGSLLANFGMFWVPFGFLSGFEIGRVASNMYQ